MRLDAFPRPPWAQMTRGLGVESLQAAVTREVRPALLAIMAAVALLLAIAGVNVTSLLLARGAERRTELATRAALGAGRGRLVRQLLTESLLLAAIGGGAGLGVAALLVRALVRLAPVGLPRAAAIGLDADTFAFAAVLTTVVGLVAGLAPAWHGARRDLRASVQAGARTGGAGHRALRRTLVGAQIGLALVVLVGAGLMLRTVNQLFARAPGFDASHVLTMKVEAVGRQYDSDEARYRFFDRALLTVRQVPGVFQAAFTSQLPLSGELDGYGVQFETVARSDPHDVPSSLRYAVTPSWFQTMGIPLRKGRLFDDRDRPGRPEAVVISETLARATFPSGTNPVGQRLRAGPEIGDDSRAWATVVGIVGDVEQTSLAGGDASAFYVPMGLWPWVDRDQSLVVRTSGDPAALAPAVRRAVWSVDRHEPIVRVTTMDDIVAASEARRRFVLVVFELFGLAALTLAATGVYGMMSTSVTERTRELGVRTALGASRGHLLAMVVAQGLRVALAGVVGGLGLALLASRLLVSLLFGVSPLDLPTYTGVVAVLLVVTAAACARPAWRAARIDPVRALRAE
jgi:putative ABC transport system permease protein